MAEPLHYYRYHLHSAAGLNARRQARVHEGLLILRNGGVGCVHPWEEFGDAPIEVQLEHLRAGERTPLLERALACCEVDGAARSRGESLFQDLVIPDSHLLLSSALDKRLWEAEAELALRDGFSTIKVKCGGPDPAQERDFLGALAKVGIPHLRLDFNARGDVVAFLHALPTGVRERIDFIEDPMPFDEDGWKRLKAEFGIRIAMDFEGAAIDSPNSFDLRVLKPSREPVVPLTTPCVVTTAMDHPVGQMFAAWEGARYPGKLETCGLLTHLCYEPNEFSERIMSAGRQLLPAEGAGLGFDDLLARLEWSKI